VEERAFKGYDIHHVEPHQVGIELSGEPEAAIKGRLCVGGTVLGKEYLLYQTLNPLKIRNV
jgi:hypothetical protein